MIFVSDLTEAKQFYCEVLGFGLAEKTETGLTFDPDAPSETDQGRIRRPPLETFAKSGSPAPLSNPAFQRVD